MLAKDTSSFRKFWNLGYRTLLPIVPVNAELSAKSSLHRALQAGKDSRGKSPGIRKADGTWCGFDWLRHETVEADLDRWEAMGAGVGLKLGGEYNLVAIDADTLDPELTKVISGLHREHFGLLPCRVGRSPKAMYFCRVSEPIPYMRIEFGKERLEILSEGRQSAGLAGDHPFTKRPYAWVRDLPPIDELPMFKPEQIVAFLEAARKVLPEASAVVREGSGADRSTVDQASLRGDPELVAKAVRLIPNTTARFPDRLKDYIKFGAAIKAALPDDPELAEDLWVDWSTGWDDFDPRVTDPRSMVLKDWGGLKPPYGVGAGWLYELAEEAAPGEFSRGEQWFQPIDGLEGGNASLPPPQKSLEFFDALSIDELFNRPDPKFVIARHVPEQSVGFLYGDPGAGKSFIALDWALHLAFGLADWHGDAIAAAPEGVVVYIAAEGASGFKTRVRAWMQAHGISRTDGRFRLIHQNVNFMQPKDVAKLMATIRQRIGAAAVLVVVDTVSRAMPGADENLQKDMTLFVAACDAVKRAFECVVLGVHHANRKGDMRGSSVLLGAGDFVFKLERELGNMTGRLVCEKQKDAPDGWADDYRFDVVQLDSGGSSLVPQRMQRADDRPQGVPTPREQEVFDAICALISASGCASTAAVVDFMEARNMTRDDVKTYLKRLAAKNKIKSERRGFWTVLANFSVWGQDGTDLGTSVFD